MYKFNELISRPLFQKGTDRTSQYLLTFNKEQILKNITISFDSTGNARNEILPLEKNVFLFNGLCNFPKSLIF